MSRKLFSRAVRMAAAGLTAALLGSCIAPFDESVTARVTDVAAPSLEVFSPADGEIYGEVVTVTGRARDIESEGHQPVTVAYEVSGPLGTIRAGTAAAPEDDGTFSFSFETLLIDGPVNVAVTATDWNGNTARVVVSLAAPASKLPSFLAVAGNEQIEISWSPVPGASEYTLRYTDNGSLPSESFGTTRTFTSVPTIEDPHVIADARNGRLYVFRLEAVVGEELFTSSYKAVVPLSPLTLAPKVSGGYRKIELEWPHIPAVDTFEVWRSQSRDSRYINYSGTVTGNRFVDPGVSVGEVYYYRVRPVLEGAPPSDPSSGVAHPFPDTEQDRRSGALLPGTASRIATVGEVALVAAGTHGLHIVDISEPDRPRLRSTYTRPDINVVDVAARGRYAVLSDAGSSGSSTDGEVLVIDVSSPTSPTLVASVAVAAPGRVAVTRDFIIVADGEAQLQIILATDLSAPGTVWSYTPPNGRAHAIAAVEGKDDHYVYVVDRADFSDPNHGYTHRVRLLSQNSSSTPQPSLISTYTHTEHIPLEVAATPSYVYTMSMEPVAIELLYYTIEVLSAGTMTLAGRDASTHVVGSSSRSDMIVRGRRLFVANHVGIRMWNISDPGEPVSIGYWNTPGPARGVALGERHVFAAAGDLGIQGVDLTAPGRFQEHFTFSEPANSVAIDGTTAYLATTSGSLVSVSLTGGGAPAMLDSVDLGTAVAVTVSGNHAFVATGTNGISVVDITDPSDMTVVGTAQQTGSTRDVSVFGDYAYVASREGLQVFRVSDPTSPQFVGFFDSRFSMNRVEVHGRIAYVTESEYFRPSVLYLIDISQPETPILIDEWYVGTMVYDLTVRDGYALMADNFPAGGTGLAVVDVDQSRPTYGTTVAAIEAPGTNEAIAAITNYVVIGASHDSRVVTLVDTTDPASISEASVIDHYDATDPVNVGKVVFWSHYLLVADRNTGLTVLDALPAF